MWENSKQFSDLWEFDIMTKKWTELHPKGPKPIPRWLHTAAPFQTEKVMPYMFQGLSSRKHMSQQQVNSQASKCVSLGTLVRADPKHQAVSGGSECICHKWGGGCHALLHE